MKIVSLKVSNFLRLEALEIVPTGNTVKITGKNNQGKSSALKAIDAALTGAKGASEQPIHGNANKAEIQVKLGTGEVISAIVTKTYIRRDGKDDLATLTVTTADGAKYPKPTEFLDKLLGGLSIDPVKFLDMKAEDQAKAIRSFVKDFDFVEATQLNKQDYTERTEVNREVKRLESELQAIPEYAGDPIEPIDVQELVGRLEAVNLNERKHLMANSKVREAEGEASRMARAVESTERDIQDLERKLESLRQERADEILALDKAKDAVNLAKSEMAALPEVEDASEIRSQIDTAEEHNQTVRSIEQNKTRRDRLQADLELQQRKSKDLTEAMAKRDADGLEAIRRAKLPVEGLSFTEDTVLLDGYPFSQASFSTRLMTAVAIASAQTPELRLVRIEDGDKLDNDSWAALSAFADANNLQVWAETVDHGSPVGFVIEDGKLREHIEE